MLRRSSLIACVCVFLLAGCASQNPYDQRAPSSNRTATYGGLGALAGAAAGALINHDNRGKGALIGAAVAGAAAAGYGYYADKQEAELRRSMEGTGIEVQREGDVIQLIMPGNITFATDSAQIASSFYAPLNNLATSFRSYNQNSIEVVGHTDSTGAHSYNMGLSQRRAQSVADYLLAQGVDSTRLSTRGMGPDQPIASNDNAEGRAQNRRVEVTLRPLAGAQ
ncbi:Outer membrane protein OmpA [Pseudomonas cuatrocienegasensis]|uniref:Outer membrane protein OmpA n=1 Tax=Pseudomonas cuatrocienegasensis TaxID=543360 RepID=A0ABY1B5R8_9PSED|nr:MULTISPECIES: OmpA family protein [Pseudomonas]OEC37442.1 cell envelope biogenesis protein OmpA [Pseudomonas sp. 21C1]SEP96936.1 Outer membrane protein OmpA [Pseudomonas cuatrocienegasensis]